MFIMGNSSIFDESFYFTQPEALLFFQEMQEGINRQRALEKDAFSLALKDYDSFLNEVAKLIISLGYHSCLDCSIILSYLISHGFLSDKKQFVKGSLTTEINSKAGTSIVRGIGCCRNYAALHQDVFEKLGEPIEAFYCYGGENKSLKKASQPANHVINLVLYRENLYGIDLYNENRLYSFKTPFILREVSPHDSSMLRYKPYYDIIMGMTFSEVKERIYRNQQYSSKESIDSASYQDIITSTIQRLDECQQTLQDFHEETKYLKKRIVEQLPSSY